MSSGATAEASPRAYVAVAPRSPLGLVLRALARPSEGQFDLAFGASPRSDQRVGLLRKATSTLTWALVGGVVIGLLTAVGPRRTSHLAGPGTSADLPLASIVVRATITYAEILLPLLVSLLLRRRVAEQDHATWQGAAGKRGRPRFVPDPRSQPRPLDLGLAVAVGAAAAVPVWTLFW